MNAPQTDLKAPVGDLQMYIDGEWTDGEGGGRMTIESPGLGTIIGTVPAGNRKDAGRAIACGSRRRGDAPLDDPGGAVEHVQARRRGTWPSYR